MTHRLLSHLLGSGTDDPGCEAAFAELDLFAEAVLRGDDVAVRYGHLITHVQNCPACREDTEGLLAALRQIEPPLPER